MTYCVSRETYYWTTETYQIPSMNQEAGPRETLDMLVPSCILNY